MDVAALIIAVIALLCAVWAVSRSAATGRQLDGGLAEQARLRAELSDYRAFADQQTAALRRESLRQAGQLKFEPGMTIAEAMAMHPRVAEILASFQLGGCSSCAISDVDTIAGACQSYGVDQAALMKALGRLLEIEVMAAKSSGSPVSR